MENSSKIDASSSHGEGPLKPVSIQEGFATLSGNMTNSISEAFKSVQADIEISYDEEISLIESKLPAKQMGEEANGRSQKCVDLETCSPNPPSYSNVGKSKVLNSSLKH